MKTSTWWKAAVAAWVLSAGVARAQQSHVVPGLMGPNALPTLPVEDAALPDGVVTYAGGAVHRTGRDVTDTAFTPRFQLVIPFRDIAALELEGAPLEIWNVSPATRDRFQGRLLSGMQSADVSFGARFALLDEGARRPALGLRLLTKSATGKGFVDRRFIDAPAYAIQALASKTVRQGDGAVSSVRVLAKLGFLAWEQEEALQDDAIDYGVAVDTTFSTRTELRVEIRGYQGYQVHDKPMLAAVRVLQPVWRSLGVELGVNRGLRPDAPDWELRAGVRFSVRTPFGER